jgi:hypothetical protein
MAQMLQIGLRWGAVWGTVLQGVLVARKLETDQVALRRRGKKLCVPQSPSRAQ